MNPGDGFVSGPLVSGTKTEAAYAAIRRGIEDGKLYPGQHLRLEDLREQLGISQTPIREALRMLEAEGVVERYPHRGVVVARVTPDHLQEIYDVRLVLEPYATNVATAKLLDEELRQIRDTHETLARLVQSEYAGPDAARLNAQWHRAIYAASRSTYLIEFIERLWGAIRIHALWMHWRAECSLRQHGAIMDALERRDPEAAGALMHDHIAYGARTTVDHFRRVGGDSEQ